MSIEPSEYPNKAGTAAIDREVTAHNPEVARPNPRPRTLDRPGDGDPAY
jgi:hypothetical protein